MQEQKKPSWGPLEKRFGGEPHPRKLLALDGGGIRGILTLQVLIKMEEVLREKSGQVEKFHGFNDGLGRYPAPALGARSRAAAGATQLLEDSLNRVSS